MKSFYQEATGITGGAGLMAVRVAAGRTIAGLMAVRVAAGRTIAGLMAVRVAAVVQHCLLLVFAVFTVQCT